MIKSEWKKLAQKENKSTTELVCELRQGLKCYHTNECYMQKPESFLKKWNTLSSLGFWDRNGPLNPDQKATQCINKQEKKTCHQVNFSVTVDQKSENERKRNNKQILGFCQGVEKVEEHEGDSHTGARQYFSDTFKKVLQGGH